MTLSDGLLRLVLTLVVLYFWTDNLLRSYRNWHRTRSPGTLRGFLIATVTELGMLTLLASALTALVPAFANVTRIVALLTTGALLVVGLWVWILWRPVVWDALGRWRDRRK